ncbi:MAG: methylated-DNA--[protein]-cysteine S-methyltransferase [Pseudomonadota bacterium]
MKENKTDYQRIESALTWIENHWRDQPAIGEIAAAVGLSESHFHRLFRRYAGITPKRLIEFLTANHARTRLMDSASVLEAALDSGLSGPGRLHDLMVNVDGATPGQIRRSGAGMTIRFGHHEGPFGCCLIAQTERGVCSLDFIASSSSTAAREQLQRRWPRASVIEDQTATAKTLSAILTSLTDPASRPALDIQGSNFQLRVWDALLRLPHDALISYGDLARALQQPGASRAVGTAVGANPVPLLIPCHRVLRQNGAFGNYSGGEFRKRAILLWESGHREAGAFANAG